MSKVEETGDMLIGLNSLNKNSRANNFSKLTSLRIIQKQLVYVIGLSYNFAYNEQLDKFQYFGQYGRITKLVVNRNKIYNANGPNGPSYSAYVTYQTPEEASLAILALDNAIVDNHLIRASYGTTKYCSNFLKGSECFNKDCLYLHYAADENDILERDDMNSNKTIFLSQHYIAMKIADIFNENIQKNLLATKSYETFFPNPSVIYEKEIVKERLKKFQQENQDKDKIQTIKFNGSGLYNSDIHNNNNIRNSNEISLNEKSINQGKNYRVTKSTPIFNEINVSPFPNFMNLNTKTINSNANISGKKINNIISSLYPLSSLNYNFDKISQFKYNNMQYLPYNNFYNTNYSQQNIIKSDANCFNTCNNFNKIQNSKINDHHNLQNKCNLNTINVLPDFQNINHVINENLNVDKNSLYAFSEINTNKNKCLLNSSVFQINNNCENLFDHNNPIMCKFNSNNSNSRKFSDNFDEKLCNEKKKTIYCTRKNSRFFEIDKESESDSLNTTTDSVKVPEFVSKIISKKISKFTFFKKIIKDDEENEFDSSLLKEIEEKNNEWAKFIYSFNKINLDEFAFLNKFNSA